MFKIIGFCIAFGFFPRRLLGIWPTLCLFVLMIFAIPLGVDQSFSERALIESVISFSLPEGIQSPTWEHGVFDLTVGLLLGFALGAGGYVAQLVGAWVNKSFYQTEVEEAIDSPRFHSLELLAVLVAAVVVFTFIGFDNVILAYSKASQVSSITLPLPSLVASFGSSLGLLFSLGFFFSIPFFLVGFAVDAAAILIQRIVRMEIFVSGHLALRGFAVVIAFFFLFGGITAAFRYAATAGLNSEAISILSEEAA